ncbi:MAG TPA: hypothetical protein VN457_05165, partial [Chlamydiales bacterium]|nr:hypothetical protein [Chlamydiales bacterium]
DKVLPTTQKTDASAKAQLAPKVPIPALAKTTKTKTPFLAPRKEAELSHLAELTYKLKQTSTDELSKNPLLLRNTTRQLNELLVNCLAAGEEMHFESLLQLHPFLIGPCDEADIEIILEAAEPGSWVLWYENALSEEGGMVRKELVGSIKEATGEIKHLTAADIAELSQDSIVNFHNLTPLNKSQHAEVLRLKDPVTQKIAAEIQKQFGESEMFRYDEGQAQTAAKKSIGQPIIHMHKNIQAPTPSSPQQDPTHFFITYSLDGRKTNQLDCKVTYDEDNDVLSVEVPLPSDDVLAGASEFLLDDSFIERIKACFEIQSRGKK